MELSLQWKAFSVNLPRIDRYLKANCSTDYDGMVASSQELKVIVKNNNVSDQAIILTYWNNLTEQEAQQPDQYEINASVKSLILAAINFGRDLVVDFASKNVLLGITQAGKTKEVVDFCQDLQRCLDSGSLYAAIDEIDRLISEGLPENLAPFITEERLLTYRTQLTGYLGL